MMFQKRNLFCPDYKFHMMMRFLIDYVTEYDLKAIGLCTIAKYQKPE